jgi:phosphopantothenoylcysteine decarboxylase/phosphopantothenate--cysteine ligase
MSKNKEVILGVCASIAIYKACEIIRRLRDAGASVSVVVTKEA